jgi:hypothetical protein
MYSSSRIGFSRVGGGSMAKSRKSPSSAALKAVLKRVKSETITPADKAILSDMLGQTIKLKQLVERSRSSVGGKKVITSLPFGFDIVK